MSLYLHILKLEEFNMVDLGDVLGSLMSGLIRARRVADEQTAALAEYYKDNPLLEGLTVPRIRIPELTIDMPLIIDDQTAGEAGQMADPANIAAAVETELKSTLSKSDIKMTAAVQKDLISQVKTRLDQIKQSSAPVMKEAIARTVQDALSDTLAKSKTDLTASQKDTLAKALRTKVSTIGIAKESVTPGIITNIKTADVKERSTNTNVVRLKITMKEEGLEWSTRASESGGVVRTLQPE